MEDTASRSGEEEAGDDQDDSSAQSTGSVASLPSSSRLIRNKAEKLRRDKINLSITELGNLVPMVASSVKRLDKTSILRLSATYLRMHQIFTTDKGAIQGYLSIPVNWCQSVLEGMDGMLVVVTASGKIVFITHNVEAILGHPQTDLLGQSIFNITSLEDHEELKRNLKPEFEIDMPSTSTEADSTSLAKGGQSERRSFYLRLRVRSVSKSDHPQFELVHVMGHLRVPPAGADNKKNRTGETHVTNEAVLVAMVKPFKEKRVTENSLIEATKEEWISRHLIDGTIVYSDHRISVVSGYMSEEVTGIHGFKYMHKDDVRWVMLALRHMYYRGESYGSSCYRLLSKNGEFIYIRTHGYLELNEDSNSVQSFICINTLVSDEEGETQMSAMKAFYTPIVTRGDTIASGIVDNRCILNGTSPVLEPLKVDDPNELNDAIGQLLSNLPADNIQPVSPSGKILDQQFEKITIVSKTMPPVSYHTSKVGVRNMPSVKKGPRYTRPSVITRAKDKRSVPDNGVVAVKKLRPETSVITMADSTRSVIRSIKEEFTEGNSEGEEASGGSTSYSCTPDTPSPPRYIPSPQEAMTPGYLTSPDSRHSSSGKQHVDYYFTNEVPMDTIDPLEERPLAHFPLSGIYDENQQVDPLGLWETEVDPLEEGIIRDHRDLEESMQFQGNQISEIEDNLTSVVSGQLYQSTFTHLKAEHRKQQQLLKNLKQDHQNIQHCKDQIVRGAQDIGA